MASFDLTPLYAGIRHFEASGKPYRPRADGPNGQQTWGFGTTLRPDMKLPPDPAEYDALAEAEMQAAAGDSWKAINERWPGAPLGARMALADLHYNTGGKQMLGPSGLATAMDAGEYDKARDLLGQYINANGRPLDGLRARRAYGQDMWNAGNDAQALAALNPSSELSPGGSPQDFVLPPEDMSANQDAPAEAPAPLDLPPQDMADADRFALSGALRGAGSDFAPGEWEMGGGLGGGFDQKTGWEKFLDNLPGALADAARGMSDYYAALAKQGNSGPIYQSPENTTGVVRGGGYYG